MIVEHLSLIGQRKLLAALAAAFLLIFSARSATAASSAVDGLGADRGGFGPAELLVSDERSDGSDLVILPDPSEEVPLDGSNCGASRLPPCPIRCLGHVLGCDGTGALALSLEACPARGPPSGRA